MLKITTPSGQLVFSPGIEIPMTITNPMFNDRGSYTLPFKVPLKPNIEILGNPLSLQNKTVIYDLIDVEIEQKSFKEKGYLKIINIADGEIECSLTTREGAFWEWAKKTSLIDLDFPDGDPFTGTISEKLDLWKQRIIDSNDKIWPDEYFNIFPVVISVENDTENEIQLGSGVSSNRILNEVDAVTGEFVFTPAPEWIDRDSKEKEITSFINISPFIYLNALISFIATKYGLILDNELETIPQLNRACIINNATLPIPEGVLDWAQLVPDITVMEFIELIEAKLGVSFFINVNNRILKVLSADTILKLNTINSVNCSVTLANQTAPLQINLKDEKLDSDYGSVVEYTDDVLQDISVHYDAEGVFIPDGFISEESATGDVNYHQIVYVKAMESYFHVHWVNSESGSTPWKLTHTFIGNRLRDHEPETTLETKALDSKMMIPPMAWANINKTIDNVVFNFSYLLPHFTVPLKERVMDEFGIITYDKKVSFPFNICIYRGKHHNYNWPTYNFPWGSSFPYTMKNYPLNDLPEEEGYLYADTLSLLNFGTSPDNIGLFDIFWTRIEQWFLKSAKDVMIKNLDLNEVIDKPIYSVFQNKESSNFIFKEIKLTITANDIRFDSATGYTTKAYS